MVNNTATSTDGPAATPLPKHNYRAFDCAHDYMAPVRGTGSNFVRKASNIRGNRNQHRRSETPPRLFYIRDALLLT